MSVQPKITLLDQNSNPVVGKQCIAYTTVEPFYGVSEGVPYYVSNLKYFAFENAVSLPSDMNGDCIFESLTIFGGSEFAYIHIAVEGNSKLWSLKFNRQDIEATDFPPSGVYPITITNKLRIEVIQNFPS